MIILTLLTSLCLQAQTSNYERALDGRDRRERAEKVAEAQGRSQVRQARYVRTLLNFAARNGGGANMHCRKYLNPWDPRSNVPICDGAACVQVESDTATVGLPQWCTFDASADSFCMVWAGGWPRMEVFAKCVDGRGEPTQKRRSLGFIE